jgi:hypothetical protein
MLANYTNGVLVSRANAILQVFFNRPGKTCRPARSSTANLVTFALKTR